MELKDQIKFAIKDEKEAIEFYNGVIEDIEKTILEMIPIRKRGELAFRGSYSHMYMNRLKTTLRIIKRIKYDEERHKRTLEEINTMLNRQ